MTCSVLSNAQEPLDISSFTELDNIASVLDEESLNKIGAIVVEDYKTDSSSRSEWEEMVDEWLKLATQVVEEKTFPWPGAANIKYPLMVTAAIQFHGRAYPAIVPGTQPIRGRVVGLDSDGTKAEKADRIAKHMSWQLLEHMEEWEEDMDKLLVALPIIGCYFKKTYYSELLSRPVSELISPKDLVVNYWASTLETARRKTHVLHMHKNDVRERQLSDIYLDIPLVSTSYQQDKKSFSTKQDINKISLPSNDSDTPYTILEQHRYLDLDEDGYDEPYIVTVLLETSQVMRISPRFSIDTIRKNSKGEIYKITPIEYFTKYSFIPNPDGGFYDIGFGMLLGPLNASINTVINQLLDAGTLATLQAGFISRGIRLKKGEARFIPGEWKQVNSSLDDLRKGIVPLPINEPSSVLFNLLGTLIESGNRLSSVTDIMVGENPGQNQPATTTMAVLEQGQKVFTAIYKRVHKSLKREYSKLFRLNEFYLDDVEYFTVLDLGQEVGATIRREDYDSLTADVIPYSDPNVVSQSQKLVKVQGLLEIQGQLGTLDPMEITKRYLDATEQANPDALFVQEQAPDPLAELELEKFRWQQQKEEMELRLKFIKEETARIVAVAEAKFKDIKGGTEIVDQEIRTADATINRIRGYIETERGLKQDEFDQRDVPGVEESTSDTGVSKTSEGRAG